jgi:hypothetical protein
MLSLLRSECLTQGDGVEERAEVVVVTVGGRDELSQFSGNFSVNSCDQETSTSDPMLPYSSLPQGFSA